ncbi:DUF418 domain-containing protein [Massilia sp. ST3]|uniref:DUF418 domain-containing protein n=1 Tax=Massilia sp. ST3 TaxID=2824903 RepID=UPI001B81F4D5|nr:DUF418 domain-containing protein [Massilia sp. ST3]MBQ5946968.1 DUF418 domain-containing protein [Massilia sp. ST3]
MPTSSERLAVVDALRGFVILAIMLLHNLEHFDLYHFPTHLPAWMISLDKLVWETLFFLFHGKAYAIFAFLFGFTFALQDGRRAAVGEDFRARFAWRLLLLLGFGLVNSMFYQGDILAMYAVLGASLLLVARLPRRLVLAIVCVLLLQPYALVELLRALPAPALKLPDPASWAYFGRGNAYLMHGSMWEVWSGNLFNGRPAAILWSWENGRLFQIPALFMLGMLACRARFFADDAAAAVRWRRIALIALVLFVPLFFAHRSLDGWNGAEGLKRPLVLMFSSWANLAFAALLVAGFALLHRGAAGGRMLARLAPLGRMSLTSYMMQSLAGTVLYYGFGLGLYALTGASLCLLIGIALAVLQIWFSSWWLRRHTQGPLEALWHRATWIGRPAAAPLRQPG